MADKRNHEIRSSGAGWFIAGILVAVLLGGGYLLYTTGAYDNSNQLSTKFEMPDLPMGHG